MALKKQVQALQNASYVNFGYDKVGDPNVVSHPLPYHFGPKINAILEGSTKGRKTCIKDVITPIGVIHEELVQAKVLQSRRRGVAEEEKVNKGYCQYHIEVQGHVIQECTKF